MDSYREEVIDPGDAASRLAKDVCVASYGNCHYVQVVPLQKDNFRGPVDLRWETSITQQMSYGNLRWAVENDGAGGKPQFFTLLGSREAFKGLGWEIITMCADDLVRYGRLPCVMLNEVQVQRITEGNLPHFQAMMQGFGQALAQSRLVNVTGETALMRHSITAFCDTGEDDQLVLTWSGACIGLSHKDIRLYDKSRIKPGMPLIGFWEPGYRCNGGTFFTKLLLAKYGAPQMIRANPEAMDFVRQLIIPSLSYTSLISHLLGWDNPVTVKARADIRGIAHITGGGVWRKLGDLLPEGVGAGLDSMPEPAPVLLQAQCLSQGTELWLPDHQAYGTFHGGCGMLVVTANEDSALAIIKEAKQFGIDAQTVGRTTESPQSEITIHSRFLEGKELSSLRPE